VKNLISKLPILLNKKHLFLLLVMILAIFLRFWNIPDTVQFLGDQGRDSLIVISMFQEPRLVFIGPVTSVGNMYLGPLYYYFMLPFLWLSFPSPLGPVYAVAFLGVLTVFLMYYLGKELIGEKAALIATSLFAFSSAVVEGTRFSWNPNPAPIVSLLMVFFIYKALKKDVRYWMLVTLCFSVLIQLHYLTLLSAAGIGLLWLFQLMRIREKKKILNRFLVSTILSAFIFVASLTPLILFDLKHEGLNINAFKDIFTKEQSFERKSNGLITELSRYVIDFRSSSRQILFDLTLGENLYSSDYRETSSLRNTNSFLGIFTLVILFWILLKRKQEKHWIGLLVLSAFLITGIMGVAAYQHSVYNHYIAYLFPIVFLILGYLLNFLYQKNISGKLLVIVFVVLYLWQNLNGLQEVLKPIGWKISDVERTAEEILNYINDGEKYNIVLLTGTGDLYGQNYRYFMSALADNKKPVDPEVEVEVDTLVIINEEKKIENVIDLPIYQIIIFPNKQVDQFFEIEDGPEITILRKNGVLLNQD
jgi:4-amino-4-deoxy-L-arabinose transferase-like glycosyltransferase